MNILIAGIGNIFLGDDAFGCEVAQRLMREPLPEGVGAFDYGIRSYDLAYDILGTKTAVILVDALPRREAPGTLSLLEIDIDQLENTAPQLVDAHSMNPVAVLQLVRSLGGFPGKIYLVGCEPELLETEKIGLSEKVQAAVPMAVDMIREEVQTLLNENKNSDEKGAALG